MDAREQAARQVIELKQAYDPSADASVMNENKLLADRLRKEHGLDDSMFGSNVSLSDSLTNFHKMFGNRNKSPSVPNFGQDGQMQQGPQQGPYRPQQGQDLDAMRNEMQNMFQSSSKGFYDSQKAQFDAMLSQQLQQLEMAYSEAVQNGELSVREAESQFEAQKKDIEKSAYQQSQATKAYGNEMGIAQSQQMVGLQQGDSARINTLQQDSRSDRDKRINDIRDRLDMINHQKNLGIAGAELEHGYNLAGAAGQASQMYNEQMGSFMQADYMNQQNQMHDWGMQENQMFHQNQMQQQGFQHDYGMSDFQHQQNLEKQENEFRQQFNVLGKQQEFNRENVATAFENSMLMMNEESRLRLEEMAQGQEYKKEEIGIMFANDMKKFAVGHGYNKELQTMQTNGQLQVAAANNQAQIDAALRQRQWQKNDLKASLDPNSNEYKSIMQGYDMETTQMVKKIEAQNKAEFGTQMIFGGLPMPGESLQRPGKDYTSKSPLGKFDPVGNVLNFITGKKKNDAKYKAEQSAIKRASDYLGVDYWNK